MTQMSETPEMTARQTQMVEYMHTYRVEAMLAQVAMTCATGDCECDAQGERVHCTEARAEAGIHAQLAAAGAAMFQGLAALEAAG